MTEEDFSWGDRPEETYSGPEGEQAYQQSMHRGNFEYEMSNQPDPRHEDYQQEIQESYEDGAYEEDDAYDLDGAQRLSVDEATLRLEQARLYEMLINFDMFGDVNVHPQAKKNVKEELKDFLVDRLEVLLGMKKDETGGARHFTSIEVKALKEVALKITGNYQHRENVYDHREEPEPEQTGLRSLGSKRVTKPQPAKVEAPNRAPQRSPQPKNVQRNDVPKREAQPANKVTRPLRKKANSTPRPALPKGRRPLKKHPYEMTEEELVARNAEINRIKPAEPSSGKMPMPSFDQEYAHHQVTQSDPKTLNLLNILKTAKRV